MKPNQVKQEISLAAASAVQAIADAAQKATERIASEAQTASKVVSVNAATAAQVLVTRNADGTSDHDLITKLDVKMDNLKIDIAELKSGTTIQINNHETRITSNTSDIQVLQTQLKVWGAALGIGFATVQFLLNYYK